MSDERKTVEDFPGPEPGTMSDLSLRAREMSMRLLLEDPRMWGLMEQEQPEMNRGVREVEPEFAAYMDSLLAEYPDDAVEKLRREIVGDPEEIPEPKPTPSDSIQE